jgi:hypothetical protein
MSPKIPANPSLQADRSAARIRMSERRTLHKSKSPAEIKQETREEQTLDTSKSDVENYISPSGGHFDI